MPDLLIGNNGKEVYLSQESKQHPIGLPQKITWSKSTSSKATQRKEKKTRKAIPIKILPKAGDYKIYFFTGVNEPEQYAGGELNRRRPLR
jgi:hypothetical protein